jgi:hypothetical protein
MSFWLMAIAYGHYLAGFIAQFSLSGEIFLDSGSPFERYQAFFSHLSLLALFIGALLLLWQGAQYLCKVAKNKRKLPQTIKDKVALAAKYFQA